MLRLLVVDDHAVVRHGVKQILQEHLAPVTVGEAGNAAEMLDLVRKGRWDLVILDIGMPGRGGLDAVHDLRHAQPKLPVLVLSAYPEDQLALRMLKAGAAGYLSKDSAPTELVQAIRKVLGGGKYVSAALAELLAANFEDGLSRAPHEQLSDREYQVLCLIASGKDIKEVAEELALSISTVNTYRTRIFKKMNMKKDAELIIYAVQNRLIQPTT